MCNQHVGVGAAAHCASALVGSVPGCLFTVALGGDMAAAAAAPAFNELPALVRIRLLAGLIVLLAPFGLRQYTLHTIPITKTALATAGIGLTGILTGLDNVTI